MVYPEANLSSTFGVIILSSILYRLFQIFHSTLSEKFKNLNYGLEIFVTLRSNFSSKMMSLFCTHFISFCTIIPKFGARPPNDVMTNSNERGSNWRHVTLSKFEFWVQLDTIILYSHCAILYSGVLYFLPSRNIH